MKCIILSAGYGTRLYPLTKFIAKPLLPVCGEPVLNFILRKVNSIKEVDQIYITTNRKFYNQFEEWLNGHKDLFDKKIKLFNEPLLFGNKRIGGVDAINRIIKKYNIKDDVLVIAGDNLFSYSLKDIYSFFKKKKSSVIVLHKLNHKKSAGNFGVVEINKDNKIISFLEKPKKPKSSLISTAIYFFSRTDLDFIKKYTQSEKKGNSFGYFMKFLYKMKPIYGFVPKGKFMDIGTIEDYKKANEIWGK
jgi:glucose-1-phosphate thymidylyltransferase